MFVACAEVLSEEGACYAGGWGIWPARGLARRGRACQRTAGRYPLGQPTLDLRSAGGSINIIKNKICSCQVVEILGRFFQLGLGWWGVFFL